MHATYDPESNAAYVYIVDKIESGEAVAQEIVSDDITLDFDRWGKLLGIEILNARRVLRPSILFRAARMIATVEPEDEDDSNDQEPA